MGLLEQLGGHHLLEAERQLAVKKDTTPLINRSFDERVEMLMRYGNAFHNDDPATALEQALSHADKGGFVVTIPELLAGRVRTERSHLLWNHWYVGHTEETAGIDTHGRLCKRGEAVLVVVHGGGLLTPARIRQARVEGLSDGAAVYTQNEFDGLLEGRLPDGTQFPIYTTEHIRDGVDELPHQFGVVMPYAMARDTMPDYHTKEAFLSNPLVLARTAGAHQYLDPYFEAICGMEKTTVGCWHPHAKDPPCSPQGRLAYLSNNDNGLGGNYYFLNYGRFVGVGTGGAP